MDTGMVLTYPADGNQVTKPPSLRTSILSVEYGSAIGGLGQDRRRALLDGMNAVAT